MTDNYLEKMYDRETLEKFRDTLTLQLTRLRGDEQTADGDCYEAVQDFIEVLEFCLEDIAKRLKMIEMIDKWVDDTAKLIKRTDIHEKLTSTRNATSESY